MVWKEQEAQKLYLFGDLKPIRIAEDLSKLGTHIPKPTAYTDKGKNWQRVAEGVAHAVPVRLRKGSPGRVSTAHHGAAHRDLMRGSVHSLWCPFFAYKYPRIFRAQGGGFWRVFRIVFRVIFFRLVIFLPPLLYFWFLLDLVIGKRVVRRMKVRVLIMESDNLWKVLSLSLLVFFL